MEDGEETRHLRPNYGGGAAPIKMGDISNVEDAEMLETKKKKATSKKILYLAIGALIIVGIVLAIVLPLTLKGKEPFKQESTFNGTVCINQTQTLMLQSKLFADS